MNLEPVTLNRAEGVQEPKQGLADYLKSEGESLKLQEEIAKVLKQ